MYAVFEFRLSQRNTAEVNIGVFRRSCCASQRRSLKDVVRLALLEERPATSANGLRVQQDEKRLSLWFRERIRRISRSSAPSGVSLYLLLDGCRYSYTNAHYTSFSILLSSPSLPSFSPYSFSQCSFLCLLSSSCSFSWKIPSTRSLLVELLLLPLLLSLFSRTSASTTILLLPYPSTGENSLLSSSS